MSGQPTRPLDHNRDRLLYWIARWHVKDKLSFSVIASKIRTSAGTTGYEVNRELDAATIGRYFSEAVVRGFVQLGRFTEQHLVDRIREKFALELEPIQITVAPDRDDMLRYAWLDLDKLLTRLLVTDKYEQILVGVSGGHTMLDFATAARSLPELEWHQEVPSCDRKKVLICSLTSGGIRTDIGALSDTVVANIASYLGAQARGLLGPAWFGHPSALKAFRDDPDVKRHIELGQKAHIILTSVGCLKDPKNLMRQLLENAGETAFITANPGLADMLYHCYDGASGKTIDLPVKVKTGLFSVIDLAQLSEKAKRDARRIVLAAGKEKSSAIPGILKRRIPSHVYMDRACAEGVIAL